MVGSQLMDKVGVYSLALQIVFKFGPSLKRDNELKHDLMFYVMRYRFKFSTRTFRLRKGIFGSCL